MYGCYKHIYRITNNVYMMYSTVSIILTSSCNYVMYMFFSCKRVQPFQKYFY